MVACLFYGVYLLLEESFTTCLDLGVAVLRMLFPINDSDVGVIGRELKLLIVNDPLIPDCMLILERILDSLREDDMDSMEERRRFCT